MTFYPMLLQSALHSLVWGGRKLASDLNKPLPADGLYGEAWEVHDSATVANGPLAGRSLEQLLGEYGHELVGPQNDPQEGFPLLIKFIDAAKWLSIQVHPDDAQAKALENDPRGKTEAWYILATEPGAQLVIGVQPGFTRDAITQAIRDNSLESLLVRVEVKAGDVLFIPAGTIHAIGAGILLYEIQQSSNVTYRLYDWGRLGLDGQPRALHVEKALTVANLATLPGIRQTGDAHGLVVELVNCGYFRTLLYQLNKQNGTRLADDTKGRSFHALSCIEGAATVKAGGVEVEIEKGQTVLIAAMQGRYEIEGVARILLSAQGD